jgi:hypothetical protein
MRRGVEIKIKAVNIRDGTESFHVGFLHRHIMYGSQKEVVANKFGQVFKLYKHSNDMTTTITNTTTKNSRFCGVTSSRLLDKIQNMEIKY